MSTVIHFSRRALIAAAAILPVALSASAFSEPQMQVLTGEVIYRQRMALPTDSVTQVQLLDVSLADAPARQIAVDRINDATGSPIPYELRFDPAAIEQGHRYALRAEIRSADGQLLFTTTTHHPVLDGQDRPGTLNVAQIAAQTGPEGSWLAEDIGGGGVIDRLQSVITIAADGRVTGSGGCNRLFGKASIDGDAISFGAMGTTRMACTPAAMDQEQKFLDALNHARRFQILPQERKLLLFDEAGTQILKLASTEP